MNQAQAATDREPTAHEAAGIDWWNQLTPQERRVAIDNAKTFDNPNPSPADCWERFQAQTSQYAAPGQATIDRALFKQEEINGWIRALQPHAAVAERIAAGFESPTLEVSVHRYADLESYTFVLIKFKTANVNEIAELVIAALADAGYRQESGPDDCAERGRRIVLMGFFK